MLPRAEFTHNHRMDEEIKQTPFYLMYRANPVALPPVTNATNVPAAEEHLKELKTA